MPNWIEIQSTMKFVIDDCILERTIHCVKNFECLESKDSSCVLKDVECCVDGKVLFLNCDEMCRYKMTFGNSRICNCPTRKAIFNKYNK